MAVTQSNATPLCSLAARWNGIHARLSCLESITEPLELQMATARARLDAVLARVATLEQRYGIQGSPEHCTTPQVQPDKPSTQGTPPISSHESEIYHAVHAELLRRGVCNFRMVRVGPTYYDDPLAMRARAVGASSEAHMCKTMVMENSRAPEDVTGWEEPRCARYYMVLVQYVAAINAEKLKAFISKLAAEVRPLPRSKINMRMVPEDTATRLTGYGHNAVTPIGSAAHIPIIVSHHITQLQEPFFLGGGETDLKVGMCAADFLHAFADWPIFVADCTME